MSKIHAIILGGLFGGTLACFYWAIYITLRSYL
jgi:hypothetical protein